MANQLCFGLRGDVTALTVDAGLARLRTDAGLSADYAWEEEAVGAALRRLALGPCRFADWPPGAEAARVMGRLLRGRVLLWWYGTPAEPVLLAKPLSGHFDPTPDVMTAAGFRLSSLAMLVYEEDRPVLYDSLADVALEVHEPGLPLLSAIFAAGRASGERTPRLPEEAARFLARCGLLRAPDAEGPFAAAWSPLEWQYHRSMRWRGALGHHAQVPPIGPIPSVPAFRRGDPATLLPLPGPADRPRRSLLEVTEARRSRRDPAVRGPTRAELGELLWTVARTKERLTDREPELLLRPIPSGGALHELSFYLAVRRCEDVEPGLYLYDGLAHGLAPVAPAGPAVDRLLTDAAQRLFIGEERPDVLIVLATRLARLAQKYTRVAYRLTMLHVGVAYEALYLAATDLGLSPCAIGFGNTPDFAAAIGKSPLEESSIGEFALFGPPKSA